MTKHHQSPLSEEDRDHALAYVLGWLDAGQASAYRDRIAASPAEMGYVRALFETMGLVGSMAPQVEPPSGLKAKLFQRLDDHSTSQEPAVEAQPEPSSQPTPRDIPQWCLGMPWLETPLPGIRRHILFEDHSTSMRGMLLNISPGGQYPAHRHLRDEYFFLIEGDLVVSEYGGQGQVEMFAGDFQRSRQGSIHGRLHSPSGCFALVICSTKDEVLEDLDLVQK